MPLQLVEIVKRIGAMTLTRADARGHKCASYEPGDLVKVDFG